MLATAWWIWLIVTAPRSPYRSLTHWTLGFTTLWLMATSLILPWFDYGKTYRPVAEAIAQALPADHGCLAERGLNDTQRASLAYFIGIEPAAADSAAGRKCDWLLVTGNSSKDLAAPERNLDPRLGREPRRRTQGKIPPLPALTAAWLRSRTVRPALSP